MSTSGTASKSLGDNNYIDLTLPNNILLSFPFYPNDTKGSFLINICKEYQITNYVICKSPTGPSVYDILYTDNPQKLNVPRNVSISQFPLIELSHILPPIRSISTQHQRIPIFIFSIDNFLEMQEIKEKSPEISQIVNRRTSRKSQILVQLQTGLVLPIQIQIEQTIQEISMTIYQTMEQLYKTENLKDCGKYRFGTIKGKYSSCEKCVRFKDEPAFLEAYRTQQICKRTPQFVYLQTYNREQAFDRIVKGFANDLDLSHISQNEEVLYLNASMSKLRIEAERERNVRLMNDPLLARMRISKTEPPLPDLAVDSSSDIQANPNRQRAFSDLDERCKPPSVQDSPTSFNSKQGGKRKLNLTVDLRSVNIQDMTQLSQQVDYDSTVNSVIQKILNKCSGRINTAKPSTEEQQNVAEPSPPVIEDPEKKKKKKRKKRINPNEPTPFLLISNPYEIKFPSPEKTTKAVQPPEETVKRPPVQIQKTTNGEIDPNSYAFVITGTEEVLAGDIPLYHFVPVRHYILNQFVLSLLSLQLVEKGPLIESIQNKELRQNRNMPEPLVDDLFEPISGDSNPNNSFDLMPCYSHSKVRENLSIFIRSISNINGLNKKRSKKEVDGSVQAEMSRFILRVSLINGTSELHRASLTRLAVGSSSVLFNEWLKLPIAISSIPRTARFSFTLYAIQSLKKKKKIPVATFNFPVFTFNSWMNTGTYMKRMWKGKDMNFFLTTCESNEKNPISISFRIPSYKYAIRFLFDAKSIQNGEKVLNDIRDEAVFSVEITKRIEKLAKSDPLTVLTQQDKEFIWNNRELCKQYPELLSSFLECINYTKPDQVVQMHKLLYEWKQPSPLLALSLLDAKYADLEVRKYAVKCFEKFTANDIMLYLLQLVQALKYELYDDSPIAEFLLRRGLDEPKFLGHQIFWQLMSEAHISHIRHRFSALVVNFMYGVGSYTEEFIKGYKFTQSLVKLNTELVESNLSYGDQLQQKFREELAKIEVPKEFHLPTDPRLVVDSFNISKCKVMNSKKKPFWLVFKNASPFVSTPVQMMFKVGDDLRQDQLTLQVMKVMELLWRTNYRDMQMNCYGVLPTGYNQGFIEVVPNAITEAELQLKRGTLAGVLDNKTLIDFIREKNVSPVEFERAQENFRLSSAGYAVATCVLGIADRHPGNIMIQKDGHFLHIDFGHFLGNFKVKMGYKRENAPFHFSPACHYALCADFDDSKGADLTKFDLFEEISAKALNVLRANAKLLITLFILMLGTGIPELRKPEDIQYLKDKLFLDKTDQEAAEEFSKLTKFSLDSTKTKLNNFFHNLKTG